MGGRKRSHRIRSRKRHPLPELSSCDCGCYSNRSAGKPSSYRPHLFAASCTDELDYADRLTFGNFRFPSIHATHGARMSSISVAEKLKSEWEDPKTIWGWFSTVD